MSRERCAEFIDKICYARRLLPGILILPLDREEEIFRVSFEVVYSLVHDMVVEQMNKILVK